MPIEVDQSNKIERTEKDTILTLSNDERRAILIPAGVKREAIARLKRRKKSSKSKEESPTRRLGLDCS